MNNAAKLSRNLSRVNVGCRQKNSKVIDNILYLSNISDFYNLRFQRPLVVALFFFIFILFLLNLNEKEIFKFKNFIFLGSIFAFSFTAYYYYFVVEVIGFFLFLVYQSNYNIKYIFYGKIKFYLVTLFTFLILSFPFLLISYGVEPDYNERLCIIDLTLSRKIILLNHLIEGLIKIKFLLIFLIISFITYFINKKKLINYKLNNVFYIVFLSSIISPFFFIIASPKTCLVYHFNNIIFHCAFLCLCTQSRHFENSKMVNWVNLVQKLTNIQGIIKNLNS